MTTGRDTMLVILFLAVCTSCFLGNPSVMMAMSFLAGIVLTVLLYRISFLSVSNPSAKQRANKQANESIILRQSRPDIPIELQQVFNSAAGGMRLMDQNGRTIRVNKKFKELTGIEDNQITKSFCFETFSCGFCHTEKCIMRRILDGKEKIEEKMEITRTDGKKISCFLTATAFRSPDGELLGIIEDFMDITALEQLLDKQRINIHQAQRILGLINAGLPRYIQLNKDSALFSAVLFSSCHVAGGDHFFIRQFGPDERYPSGRTALSIKDQSGHEVGCILKSIATDFVHNTVLNSRDRVNLRTEAQMLNRELCSLSLFHEDDFITAILGEIDHASMRLHYISCGHPPFLLIRDRKVLSFPDGPGIRQCPLAIRSDIQYAGEQIQLQQGDRLIFYTDGLTEMSLRNTGKILSTDELKDIVRSLIEIHGPLHVLELINKVLEKIARLCGEDVIPFIRNSSEDDVTLLGIEIEDIAPDGVRELFIGNIYQLSQSIEQLLETLTFQAKENRIEIDPYQLRLVLDESLTNAWKHAHGCNPEKQILVRWRFRNDLFLEVIDQGPGFDFAKLADPRARGHLCRESGRGLFLIRLFADYVCWKDHGRHIQIALKRPVQQDRRNTLRVSTTSPGDRWKVADE